MFEYNFVREISSSISLTRQLFEKSTDCLQEKDFTVHDLKGKTKAPLGMEN